MIVVGSLRLLLWGVSLSCRSDYHSCQCQAPLSFANQFHFQDELILRMLPVMILFHQVRAEQRQGAVGLGI